MPVKRDKRLARQRKRIAVSGGPAWEGPNREVPVVSTIKPGAVYLAQTVADRVEKLADPNDSSAADEPRAS
jgi:hypothetical protein